MRNLIDNEDYQPEVKPPDEDIEQKISNMLDEKLKKIQNPGEVIIPEEPGSDDSDEKTIIEENEENEKED